MAKILSPLISVGSGSVAGLTFTRTREHQVVIRQRTVPVNPNTEPQQHIRSAFALAVTTWEDIVQATRDLWEAYALTLSWKTKLGNSYTPTGRQVFIQVYSYTKYLGALGVLPAFVRTTPGTEEAGLPVPGLTRVDLAAPGTGFALQSINDFLHKIKYGVVLGNPVSNATNFYKGPYDTATTVAFSNPAESTSTEEFTGLVDGKRYPWKARPFVDDETDQAMRLGAAIYGIATATIVSV